MKMKDKFLKILLKYEKQNMRIKELINQPLEIVSGILKNNERFVKLFYFICNWHRQIIYWQKTPKLWYLIGGKKNGEK